MSEPRKKKRLQITGNQRFQILQRDAFKCVYCGIPSTHTILEIDHIVPIACGGTNSPLNLAACCPDCNTAKGSEAIPLDQLPEALARRHLEHEAEQYRLRAAFVAGRLFDAPVPHVDEWIKSIANAMWDGIDIDVLVRMADKVRAMNFKSNRQRLLEMNELVREWNDPDMQVLRSMEGCDDIQI